MSSEDTNAYIAVHYWISKQKGKASFCTIDASHVSKRFEWANISREYKKDLDDWIQLCHSCHLVFDKHKLNISELREKIIELKVRKEIKLSKSKQTTKKNKHPLQFYFPLKLLMPQKYT